MGPPGPFRSADRCPARERPKSAFLACLQRTGEQIWSKRWCWPSEEPLPLGTNLLLPVYRSTTPIPAGMQLLVPGYLPSTQLPAGEWIYLPARRSAPVLEELPA